MLSLRATLRTAVPLAAVWLVSACAPGGGNNDNPALSQVTAVDEFPVADTTTRVNINTTTPTLNSLPTFQVNDGDQLTLVWSDEFNATRLDPEVWFFATGDGSEVGLPSGWGNNEKQWYLPDNARLEDGKLKIEARRETVKNSAGEFGYTSARMNTSKRIAVKYGRIEASIKLPGGQGIWPAFWMLPEDNIYGTFAASGEIDIVEAINLDGTQGPGGFGGGNEIFGTIHFGGVFPANQSASVNYVAPEDVTEGFHTYAVEWSEFEIRWYFDGILYAVQNSWFSDGGPFPAPFDQPFHILLNLAVGGTFPGDPNSSTPAVSTMEVDWVRVYSGEEGSTGGGNPTEPPASAGIIPDHVVYATDPAVNEDLAPPGFDNFGSGATFNGEFTADSRFSPAFQVTSGEGYGEGVHSGFVAFTGYSAGFAQGYESLHFKIKADAANLAAFEVKFFAPDNSQSFDLTNFSGVTDIGDGWLQVSIPMSGFAANIAGYDGFLIGPLGGQAAAFNYLVTDIGFNDPTAMSAGITPKAVVYATDPAVTEDLAPPGFDNFGSGATFDGNFMGDADFNPAFQVTSGEGYGEGIHSGFVAFTGYNAGFASGFTNLHFKVKGDASNLMAFEVKFFGPDNSQTYDLTTYSGTTALDNGWIQVTIPMSDFAANIDAYDGFLMGPLGGQAAAFNYLLTDIGFDDVAMASPAITPEAVVYATDPNVTEDLAPPGIDNFGSGAVFEGNFTGDADFNPAFQVTSGEGYGEGVHSGFVAFTGYSAGFASSFDTLHFKVKADAANIAAFEVKFFQPDQSQTYDLTTYPGVADLGNGWLQVSIPMSDFAANIASNDGFLIGPFGGQPAPFSYLLTDIGFSTADTTPGGGGNSGGGSTPTGSQLAINGGLEEGDFTGWQIFPNGGTATVTNTDPKTGSFSANSTVVAPGGGAAPAPPILKQESVGVDVVLPNETINISFDLKGSVTNGGFISAEFFSERESGADLQTLEVINAPNADWTSYSYTVTTSDDVTRGITLQFVLICGAIDGCSVEADIDNVSITRSADDS